MTLVCEMKKAVVECDCGQELILLTFEEDEPEDLCFLYMSFYRNGNLKRGWREKIKHIWQIIKTGSPWEDMVVLRKCERLKLTEFLNSLPR